VSLAVNSVLRSHPNATDVTMAAMVFCYHDGDCDKEDGEDQPSERSEECYNGMLAVAGNCNGEKDKVWEVLARSPLEVVEDCSTPTDCEKMVGLLNQFPGVVDLTCTAAGTWEDSLAMVFGANAGECERVATALNSALGRYIKLPTGDRFLAGGNIFITKHRKMMAMMFILSAFFMIYLGCSLLGFLDDFSATPAEPVATTPAAAAEIEPGPGAKGNGKGKGKGKGKSGKNGKQDKKTL